MLSPPTKGFARSVNVHNGQLDATAEWLEGCITFIDDTISKVDVKDILHEEDLYPDQDFAQAWVDEAWLELGRRVKCLGPVAPYSVESKRLVRTIDWDDSPAYSFCLMVALQVPYRESFTKLFGANYADQGQLFETVTTEALRQIGLLPHSTAWSRSASESIGDKVEAVGKHLGEPHRAAAVGRWTAPRAKDCGLDVVCHQPFPDGWAGRPLYFVQCASGENWQEKCHTPDIHQWNKLVEFATEPTRGIAHPFVLLEDDFRRSVCRERLSLVLDRHRISRPGPVSIPDWTPPMLSAEMKAWTRKRLKALKKHVA